MNLKYIINAVKVTSYHTFCSYSTYSIIKSLSKQNNWTDNIEIEKYLK